MLLVKSLAVEITGKQYALVGDSYYAMLMRVKAFPGRTWRESQRRIIWLLPGTLSALQSSLAPLELSDNHALIEREMAAVLSLQTTLQRKPSQVQAQSAKAWQATQKPLNVLTQADILAMLGTFKKRYHSQLDQTNSTVIKPKPKRVIFRRSHLELHGMPPYCLSLKLQGESLDDQTKIGYRQASADVQALIDWLYADAGFEWAIACDHKPETSLQESVYEFFGVLVATQEWHSPKPWDAVLGGLEQPQKPTRTGAVLGGYGKFKP